MHQIINVNWIPQKTFIIMKIFINLFQLHVHNTNIILIFEFVYNYELPTFSSTLSR